MSPSHTLVHNHSGAYCVTHKKYGALKKVIVKKFIKAKNSFDYPGFMLPLSLMCLKLSETTHMQ